eukprot:Skav236818  [mRNA]  locus=scaffold2823:53695:55023:- [translate_table: standard]
MHSSGAFGQLARRLILSFKRASFEAVVKLYDSVHSFLNDKVEEVEEMEVSHGSKAARQVPSSMGRLPFACSGEASPMVPRCAQHRFVDAADTSLRSFYEKQVSENDGRPVQNAILTLANLNLEMRHVDDALQALEDSIRAAQETSDGSCLCACLYLLSFILLPGSPSMAFSMMQRCLERSEALGLPLLQCFCCMAIARTLTLQPERKLAASLSLEGEGAPSATASVPSFGFSRNGSNGSSGSGRQSFGLLAALSHPKGSPGRDAFAHSTMASFLSTAGALRETRPKVLLCNAGISEVFGLHGSKKFATKLLLELYKDQLTPEDLSLALCQGLCQGEGVELRELPHAALWMMPKLCSDLLKRNSSAVELGAVVVPTAGALRAVPQSLAADAALRWRLVTNETRLQQGQLLAAMKSLQEGTAPAAAAAREAAPVAPRPKSLGLC